MGPAYASSRHITLEGDRRRAIVSGIPAEKEALLRTKTFLTSFSQLRHLRYCQPMGNPDFSMGHARRMYNDQRGGPYTARQKTGRDPTCVEDRCRRVAKWDEQSS